MNRRAIGNQEESNSLPDLEGPSVPVVLCPQRISLAASHPNPSQVQDLNLFFEAPWLKPFYQVRVELLAEELGGPITRK